MSQFVAETSITNGHLELRNIPFANDIPVKVIIIPQSGLVEDVFPSNWGDHENGQGKAF